MTSPQRFALWDKALTYAGLAVCIAVSLVLLDPIVHALAGKTTNVDTRFVVTVGIDIAVSVAAAGLLMRIRRLTARNGNLTRRNRELERENEDLRRQIGPFGSPALRPAGDGDKQ